MQPTFSESTINQIKESGACFVYLAQELGKVIVGHEDVVQFITIGLLCNGHILLEGVPGVAKTTMVKTVASALGLQCKRIQFTPDLLPLDLIGTLIYNQKTQDFEVKKGPIFANLILADEINRAPAKVQSALLEVMQEHQVTIGSTTFVLEEPFLVFATQNPIEQEGTYALPEAQIDRFMFKLLVDYPLPEQEKEILSKVFKPQSVQQVLDRDTLLQAHALVGQIYIDPKVVDYLVALVFATRKPADHNLRDIKQFIRYGVSPRATLALHHAARAYAFLQGRHFTIPDDVKAVARAALRHRILLTYEAEIEGVSADDIISRILEVVPAP